MPKKQKQETSWVGSEDPMRILLQCLHDENFLYENFISRPRSRTRRRLAKERVCPRAQQMQISKIDDLHRGVSQKRQGPPEIGQGNSQPWLQCSTPTVAAFQRACRCRSGARAGVVDLLYLFAGRAGGVVRYQICNSFLHLPRDLGRRQPHPEIRIRFLPSSSGRLMLRSSH